MSDFQIRPYTHNDNEAVLAIARTLDIPARVRLGIDRSPDYTAFDDMVGDPYEILVTETGGEVIAFVEINLTTFSLFGIPVKSMYLPLGGVREDWRRKGIIKELIKAAQDYGRKQGATLGYSMINANNRAIQAYKERFGPDIFGVGRLLVQGLVLPWRPASPDFSNQYTISQLDPSDWDEFLTFIKQHLRKYDLYPLIADHRWHSLSNCSPDNFYLARDRVGNIIASIGIWDPYTAKRALILQYGSLETKALGTVNRCLRLMKRRPFPEPGGSLHNLYTLLPLVSPGHEAAFGKLVNRLLKQYRDFNMLLVALPEGDPRHKLFRRFIRFTNVNIPVIQGLTPESDQFLTENMPKNLYLEYAFL